jgi:hypothetical protein
VATPYNSKFQASKFQSSVLLRKEHQKEIATQNKTEENHFLIF